MLEVSYVSLRTASPDTLVASSSILSSLVSGTDYTIAVADTSSDAKDESEEFTILGGTDQLLEVTAPTG